MTIDGEFRIRPAVLTDQRQIGNLIHFSSNVHRHLDWRGPLEWVGSPPFYVLEKKGEVIAALGCPPEPPSVAWIRLFVNSGKIPYQDSWQLLWDKAHGELIKKGKLITAAIVLQDWMRSLLLSNGFTSCQSIVMLERDGDSPINMTLSQDIIIRAMMPYDLPVVAELDSAAFELLWQNTLPVLERAYPQAVWPTLAESGRSSYRLPTKHSKSNRNTSCQAGCQARNARKRGWLCPCGSLDSDGRSARHYTFDRQHSG